MPEVLDTYDYLIVGAGPAGCLLANRLSAQPARDPEPTAILEHANLRGPGYFH